MVSSNDNKDDSINARLKLWYGLLVIVIVVFIIQLFNIEVIHYQKYKNKALSYQLEAYNIPATRGLIEAKEGNSIVPIVLNQELYTLYADPPLIKNLNKTASRVTSVIGGNVNNYKSLMSIKGTQYVILAHKITASQNSKILSYKMPGIGSQGQDYRAYPDGSLAAQVLGFVNNSGVGEYGLEQAMNKQLSGTPGRLKAITDANGVPLAASKGNIDIPPKPGDNVVTTLNLSMQAQMEKILASEYKKTKSHQLSAIIMNPYNGQVLAMANYPTYNPNNYQNVSNQKLFQNAAVDYAIEPGSTMKTLTTPTAINVGAITPSESFYDPAHWVIDGFNIHDISIDGGAREQNIASILSLSLNTGATWMLMQMSNKGHTQITAKGIDTWHNYMVNHFRLGQPTGIEQGYQASGYVPPPDMADPSINLTYANTAFGQGVTMTAIQQLAAFNSVIDGGIYFKPTLVSELISPSGKIVVNKPKILEKNVVAPSVGKDMIPLLQNVVKAYLHGGSTFMNFPANYIVGGKTGTAQVAAPTGGYYKNIFNGTYIGFVGGDQPQYTIIVYNIKPNVAGYAGTNASQPVFADLAHMLINEGYVIPRT